MKIILKLVAVLVIIVVLALVGVYVYLDSIAKSAIESGATKALGVETTLKSAHVGLFAGTFSMGGLEVANPEGFDTDHFMTLDEGDVAVSLGTLTQDTVELPTLTLDQIDMNLEKKGATSNYDVILENLKSEEDAPQPKEGKKFIIRKLVITDVQVHANLLPLGGSLSTVTIPIDRIELTDVGSESDKGVVMWELSGVLIKAIIMAAIQEGGDLLPQDILGELSGQLGRLESLGSMGIDMTTQIGAAVSETVGGVAGEAGKVLEDATKGVGEVLEDIGGGLLGGGDDEKEKKKGKGGKKKDE